MAEPVDMNGPAYTDPNAIKQRYSLADALTGRATQPFAPNWMGALAAGITGAQGAITRGSAEGSLAKNQQMTNDLLTRAGAAKTNADMSRILMSGGIPGMAERGLDVIVSDRQKAADRAAALEQQKTLAKYTRDLDMASLPEKNRLEIAKTAEIAAIQKRLGLETEREGLENKLKTLGLSPTQTTPAATPSDATHSAPAPAANAAATPEDPYLKLISPDKTPEQEAADRKRRAGMAIALGDTKGASNILNKSEDLKEGQSKDAFYSERMARTEIDLRRIMPTDESGKPTGYDPTSSWKKFSPDINILTSGKGQEYQRAAREWIAGLLRKDTGAAVTDSEWALYFPTYLPQAGDSPQVVQDKFRARVALARGLRNSSGPAFNQMFPRFDAEMRQHLATIDPAKYGPKPEAASPGAATPSDTPVTPKRSLSSLEPAKQVEAIKRLRSAAGTPNEAREVQLFKDAFGEDALAEAQRIIRGASFQPAGQ